MIYFHACFLLCIMVSRVLLPGGARSSTEHMSGGHRARRATLEHGTLVSSVQANMVALAASCMSAAESSWQGHVASQPRPYTYNPTPKTLCIGYIWLPPRWLGTPSTPEPPPKTWTLNHAVVLRHLHHLRGNHAFPNTSQVVCGHRMAHVHARLTGGAACSRTPAPPGSLTARTQTQT